MVFAPAFRVGGRQLGVIVLALLVIAELSYFGLLWNVRSAILPRAFNFPPNPCTLYEHYREDDVGEIKQQALETMVDALRHNDEQIWRKADGAKWGLVCVLVESLALTLALAVG